MATTVAPAVRLAPQLAHNLLINPGFEIWQRGAGPFTADTDYTADEWQMLENVGDVMSVQRNSSPKFGQYALEVSVSTWTANNTLDQGIEMAKSLEGQWLTFSAWVKCSTPNAVQLLLQDYDGVVGGALSTHHSGSGLWEQLTVSYQFRTGLVTGWTTIPHSFAARVGFYFTGTQSGTVIDGVSLVVGEYREGIDFFPLNPAEDMQRCQRFYEVQNAYGFPCWDNTAANYNVGVNRPFAVQKQAVPTTTVDTWSWAGGAGPSTSAYIDSFNLWRENGSSPNTWSAQITAEVT